MVDHPSLPDVLRTPVSVFDFLSLCFSARPLPIIQSTSPLLKDYVSKCHVPVPTILLCLSARSRQGQIVLVIRPSNVPVVLTDASDPLPELLDTLLRRLLQTQQLHSILRRLQGIVLRVQQRAGVPLVEQLAQIPNVFSLNKHFPCVAIGIVQRRDGDDLGDGAHHAVQILHRQLLALNVQPDQGIPVVDRIIQSLTAIEFSPSRFKLLQEEQHRERLSESEKKSIFHTNTGNWSIPR